MKMWDWDISSRAGGLPDAGGKIVAHEHDYSKTAVIYDENGVQVTSFPAVHIRDGATFAMSSAESRATEKSSTSFKKAM